MTIILSIKFNKIINKTYNIRLPNIKILIIIKIQLTILKIY